MSDILHQRFNEFLELGGAEMLLLTNDYEISRFKTVNGVCVVYQTKKGKVSFSNEFAKAAFEAFLGGKKWNAHKVFVRTARQKVENQLLKRDGNSCFYCGTKFTDELPPTLEHILSIADGGNNNVANLALCCEDCNLKAASLPIVEKVRLRDKLQARAA